MILMSQVSPLGLRGVSASCRRRSWSGRWRRRGSRRASRRASRRGSRRRSRRGSTRRSRRGSTRRSTRWSRRGEGRAQVLPECIPVPTHHSFGLLDGLVTFFVRLEIVLLNRFKVLLCHLHELLELRRLRVPCCELVAPPLAVDEALDLEPVRAPVVVAAAAAATTTTTTTTTSTRAWRRQWRWHAGPRGSAPSPCPPRQSPPP